MYRSLLAFVFLTNSFPAHLLAQANKVAEDIDRTFGYTHGFIYETWSNSTAEAILDRMSASPSTYIDEIESRFVFPGNDNLTQYPDLINDHNWPGLFGLLSTLGENDIGKAEVLTALANASSEILEDIDLIQDELLNNPPADPSELQTALKAASFMYIAILQKFARMEDPSLLPEAVEVYDSQVPYVQGIIEEHSLILANNFPPTRDLNITSKWQLIGLPLDPFDKDSESVFSDTPLESGPFSFEVGGYAEQTTVELGKAYWIRSLDPGTAAVLGSKITDFSLDLIEGWNMIAVPHCDSGQLDYQNIIDNGSILSADQPFYFSPTGYENDSYLMNVDLGYWVFASSAGSIKLDCTADGAAKTTPFRAPDIPESFGTIAIQDAAGGIKELYFGGTLPDDFPLTYRMPPRPFRTMFDARLSGDVKLTETDTANILVQASQYPITVELVRMPLTADQAFILEEVIGNQVVATRTIAPGTPLQVTDENMSILRVRPE